jgi:hypothetical protein
MGQDGYEEAGEQQTGGSEVDFWTETTPAKTTCETGRYKYSFLRSGTS